MDSKILPMEDMLGIGGWCLYLFLTGFLIVGLIVCSHLLYVWCGINVGAIRVFRQTRDLRPLLPHLWIVEKLALLKGFAVVVTLSIIVAGLASGLVELSFRQRVQLMRFDRQQCELVYRWSMLDVQIPYNTITRVKWEKIPMRPLFIGPAPKRPGAVRILIETSRLTYIMEAAAHGPEMENAKAIYEELLRHSDAFAHAVEGK